MKTPKLEWKSQRGNESLPHFLRPANGCQETPLRCQERKLWVTSRRMVATLFLHKQTVIHSLSIEHPKKCGIEMDDFYNPSNLLLLRDLLNPTNSDSESETDEDDRVPLSKVTFSSKPTQDGFDSQPSPSADPKPNEPQTIEEFMEQEAKLIEDELEQRICPEYNIIYKQAVAPEDIYLPLSTKTPATACCEQMCIEILMPNETVAIDRMTLDVRANDLALHTPVYRLNIPLPQQINPDHSKAEWDEAKKLLKLTLRVKKNWNFHCPLDPIKVKTTKNSVSFYQNEIWNILLDVSKINDSVRIVCNSATFGLCQKRIVCVCVSDDVTHNWHFHCWLCFVVCRMTRQQTDVHTHSAQYTARHRRKRHKKKIHFAHANRRRIILVFVAIFFLLLCGSPSSSVCFDFHSIPECCVRSRWIFHQILLHRNTIEFNRREHTHTHTQAHRDNVSDGDTIRSKLNWTSFFANSHKVITNQLVTV